MLSQSIEGALNEHCTQEFYAAYLYFAMAAHCDAQSLTGAVSACRQDHERDVKRSY